MTKYQFIKAVFISIQKLLFILYYTGNNFFYQFSIFIIIILSRLEIN